MVDYEICYQCYVKGKIESLLISLEELIENRITCKVGHCVVNGVDKLMSVNVFIKQL
jgi:hypothetical protein